MHGSVGEHRPFAPWSRGDAAVAGAFRMGLAPLEAADWLPAPEDAVARLANRLAVLREHPEAAFHCPPDARDAAREVHELVQQALAT
ncbi:MAG: hypothetical protein V2I63_04265, partial [Pseudomonadales bacterium]|nr:hypothetical protein [Pseudomonadales bacterium]